jgi:type VI secretion system protein ImpK
VSKNDPFFTQDDNDRTVIRPMPGGRRAAGAPPPPLARHAETDRFAAVALQVGSGLNPLVRCASRLLIAAGQLRGCTAHADPDGLRNRLVSDVREFESCARAKGIPDSKVLPARYALCSLLDEAVLGTPWGSESIWARQGLLISFHNEAWGGEKFFLALEQLIAYPSGNLHILELMYLCLSLGFEGRYRIREGGRDQLEVVRERLYQTIRAQRGEPERELSPNWRGVVEQRDPLIPRVPLWVLSAISGVLLLGLFTGFTFALHTDSDPVFVELSNLDVPTGVVPQPPRPPKPKPPTSAEEPAPLSLGLLLADEIAAGRVDVVGTRAERRETVLIQGDNLFRSGKASINKKLIPLLNIIGAELKKLPGKVLVTGHTDSIPIRTLEFPSNQVLSARRARNVAQYLGEVTGEPDRFTAKGLADSQPRVPEDPTDARNRRVEISLRYPFRVIQTQ